MKTTLDIQPEYTVALAVKTYPMNIVGPYSHWPRRQSKVTQIYDLKTDSRFDPVVLS